MSRFRTAGAIALSMLLGGCDLTPPRRDQRSLDTLQPDSTMQDTAAQDTVQAALTPNSSRGQTHSTNSSFINRGYSLSDNPYSAITTRYNPDGKTPPPDTLHNIAGLREAESGCVVAYRNMYEFFTEGQSATGGMVCAGNFDLLLTGIPIDSAHDRYDVVLSRVYANGTRTKPNTIEYVSEMMPSGGCLKLLRGRNRKKVLGFVCGDNFTAEFVRRQE